MTEKTINTIGWFASSMAVAMYVSYIDQIRLNLAGTQGSILLPLLTVVNCTSWVVYGSLKPKKDWPIIVCNAPGVLLGVVTAITAL